MALVTRKNISAISVIIFNAGNLFLKIIIHKIINLICFFLNKISMQYNRPNCNSIPPINLPLNSITCAAWEYGFESRSKELIFFSCNICWCQAICNKNQIDVYLFARSKDTDQEGGNIKAQSQWLDIFSSIRWSNFISLHDT